MTSPKTPGPAGDLVVRELRWTDFDAFAETYYLLYEEREVQPEIGIHLFRTRPSHEDEVAWFANLYRRVLSGETIVAVAERGGRAIGHCTIASIGPTPESENSHVGTLGILVHRDHRGGGAGRALMASALAQCAGKFDTVRLGVFSVNTRARRLYEEFGFVYVGTMPRGIRRGNEYFDEDLMVKDVRKSPANR